MNAVGKPEMTIRLTGHFNAMAHFRKTFELHPADQARLEKMITDSQALEGRSFTFKLEHPITIHGITYRSIRCKGISPKFKPGPDGALIIPPHLGDGYVAHPVRADAEGKLYTVDPTPIPEGTNILRKAKREFDNALRMTEHLADYVLGYGSYDNLSFNGEEVGFVAYAMEPEEDRRLFKDVAHEQVKGYCDEMDGQAIIRHFEGELGNYFYRFGQALSQMHRLGLVHGSPHLDNVGVARHSGRVFMRDLDTAVWIADMPAAQRFGFLLIDLARVMGDLCTTNRFDNGEEIDHYTLEAFVPYFLRGYFAEAFIPEGSLAFLMQIHMQEGKPLGEDLLHWTRTNRNALSDFFVMKLIENFVPELMEAPGLSA